MLAPAVSLTTVRELVHAAGEAVWGRTTAGVRDAFESASLLLLPNEIMKMADAHLFEDFDGSP
jgi:hypothetical protein